MPGIFRSSALLLLLAIFAFQVACGDGDSFTANGIVVQKAVTGRKEGTGHTLVILRLDDEGRPIVYVNDASLEGRVSEVGAGLAIDDALMKEIEATYQQVEFVVNIDTEAFPQGGIQPGAQSFLATRALFNALPLGEEVRFKAKTGEVFPVLIQLLD